MADEPMRSFVCDVTSIVEGGGSERRLTARIAGRMRVLLEDRSFLNREVMQPHPERYVMYPLHVDPTGRFSVASAVWGVGQRTPVHDHGTWGVIGIYAGNEDESRYTIIEGSPVLEERRLLTPGDVEVCCTADRDVHAVGCASVVPCVGLHVYGADIGTLPRRAYDERTRKWSMFVSSWASPASER